MFKVFATVVGGFIALTAFGFLMSYVGLFHASIFGPAYEQVRRNTFEQSQSYNEGMVRDLENLKMQYEKADDEEKIGLRATIIHRFSAYPNQLPPRLASFYSSLTR